MTVLNFLRDAPRDVLLDVLEMRIPARFRAVTTAAAAVALLALVILAVESARIGTATAEEERAQQTADRAAARLHRAQAAWGDVVELFGEARRIERIEDSGVRSVRGVMQVGAAVGKGVWLTDLVSTDGSAWEVQGRVSNLGALAPMLVRLHRRFSLGSMSLGRNGFGQRGDAIPFDLHLRLRGERK